MLTEVFAGRVADGKIQYIRLEADERSYLHKELSVTLPELKS